MPHGRVSVLVIAASICLVGCTSSGTAAYNDVLSKAKAENNSDYVVEVFDRALADGSISASDYRDSQQKLSNCYQEAGLSSEAMPDEWGIGVTRLVYSSSSPDADALAEACVKKWDGEGNYSISNIYYSQVVNPKNEDMDTLVAQCLVRNNLVPKDFDAGDYREFVAANSAKCSGDVCTLPDGTTFNVNDPLPPTGQMVFPGGKSAESFEARKCEHAPLADLEK